MDTKVRSGAPLPYRPKPIALQAKPASAAPPVYRPQQFTQAKLAAPPPVYRPVSMPLVTQRQTAVVTGTPPNAPGVGMAPAVPRPTAVPMQPKRVVPFSPVSLPPFFRYSFRHLYPKVKAHSLSR